MRSGEAIGIIVNKDAHALARESGKALGQDRQTRTNDAHGRNATLHTARQRMMKARNEIRAALTHGDGGERLAFRQSDRP